MALCVHVYRHMCAKYTEMMLYSKGVSDGVARPYVQARGCSIRVVAPDRADSLLQ